MHLEEDNHKPLNFDFFTCSSWKEILLASPKRHRMRTPCRTETSPQACMHMLGSLYLQKENAVGQMNSPYSICGSLYFVRSRGGCDSGKQNHKGYSKCSAVPE